MCDSLEILELDATSLDGSGLVGLDRFQKLRVLRLRKSMRFDLGSLPFLPELQYLSIEGLPAGPWGFDRFMERQPALVDLTLGAVDTLDASGTCPTGLRRLSLRARRLSGIPRLPEVIECASIHLAESEPGELEALFAHVQCVEFLDLNGTPTTESAVLALIERFGPRYVDITDTGIDEASSRRIAAAHPGMRMHPKYR